MHRSNADADVDADEEGEARGKIRGDDLSEDKELISRGGYDMVDAAGGRCMGGAKGRGGGPDIERPPHWPSPRLSLIYH